MSALTDVVVALSAVVTAVTAVYALRTWRRQLVGTRRAEVAEDVLTDCYEYQAFLRAARSAGFSSVEAEERDRGDNETEFASGVLDMCYAIRRRFQNRSDLRARLLTHEHRFRAVFGEKAAEPFGALREADAHVLTAVNMMATLALRGQQATPDIDDRVFYHGRADDPIDRQVADAVEALARVCRPAIEARDKPF